MQTKLFRVLFVLHFLFLSANAEVAQYDNSQLTDNIQSNQNISTCDYQATEHFVVEKASLSARMHLTTESIFQTILNKLHFLAQIQPKNIMKEDGHWFTEDIFSNVFKFTQLLSSGQTGYDTMCTPFLYLHSGNSSVCKLRSTIRFSPIACSTLIAQMFPVYNWNNNSFVETLSKFASS